MSERERKEVANRFARDEEVNKAVTDAVKNAIAEHARKGQKVVVWRDGKPVWVDADDIDGE